MNSKNIRVISFYLPQFHTIPENNEAYGEGFTEWTNTRKAKPLFEGHNQPRTPLNDNYYCLLDDGVIKNQVKMAKENGIYGFCYYHYWFKNGKKLLEKPLEMMLQDKSIDMPFCMCWANENWTKRWDGGNNDIIVEQDYGDFNDLDNHIVYLCNFFRDNRYIKIDGKPVLLIYKPELIPNLSKVVKHIRQRVKENGFKGIVLMVQYPEFYLNGAHLKLFDNYIQFEPKFIQDYQMNENRSLYKKIIKKAMLNLNMNDVVATTQKLLLKNKMKGKLPELIHRSYDDDWKAIIDYHVSDKRLIAGAFVDWDNTSRNRNGVVYDGTTPEKFQKYMLQLVDKVDKEYNNKLIFINAWNEWAEGAYLEPDSKNGYAYLSGIKRVLDKYI